MSDTPPISHPPSRLDVIKALVGDLARPFAIIATSYAAAHSTIVIAHKVDSFEGAATFIGAVFLGVGALYGAKAWEIARTGKQAAEVEIARSGPSPAAAAETRP